MSLLGELSYALISPSSRAIGTIIPDVVVEESHRDELIITQHPVEKGAAITDHAFKRPSEVDMRCGFSNATAGSEGYVQEVYQALLALQATRRPFTVYTGKRAYRNMLIRGLLVTTDPRSENVLMVVASLQEIIIVSTQTTGTGTATTASGSGQGNQADLAITGSVANLGSQDGIGTGNASFAGAFSPGNYSPDGGAVGDGSFGSGIVGSGAGGGLDGLSPPLEVTLPEQSVTGPDTGGLQSAAPDYYNMFGGGP